jgi:hypothetical protein
MPMLHAVFGLVLRLALLAAIAAVLSAAPASAGVVALSGFRAAGTPRLDGGRVYWLQEGRGGRVVLRRASVRGTGAERIASFAASRPEWHLWSLLVSGRRIGLLEALPGDLHQDTRYELRYGPLGGPYTTKRYALGERGPYRGGPYLVGDGVGFLTVEPTALVTESAARSSSLAVPQARAAAVRGGRIALAQADRVLVLDARDGAQLRSLALPPDPAGATVGAGLGLFLDADGGVAVQYSDGDGHPIATLHAGADDAELRPVHVPESIVAFGGGKVATVHADGYARRALVRDLRHGGRTVFRGPPDIEIDGMSVSADAVAWSTGVCQFVATFSDQDVRRRPAGPCARTVTTLRMHDSAENMARNRVDLRVGCLASDGRACRIRLEMTVAGSAAFAIGPPIRVAVGRSRTVRMHLPSVVTRCARSLGWAFDAVGRDADGGRPGHYYDSYGDPPESLANVSYSSRTGVRRCRAVRRYLARR